MKLIDILVRELPKRGGWPDGAEYIAQDNGFNTYKGTVCGFVSKPRFNGAVWLSKNTHEEADFNLMKLDVISCDHHESIITREQYEAALAATKEPKMNWKYIKGSEKDFLGAMPSNATHAFMHKECEHLVYTSRPEIIREDLFTLKAQREPVAEWDGVEFPPVGEQIEYACKRESLCHPAIKEGEWYAGTIIAYHDGCVWTSDNGLRHLDNTIFRKLRTEADKKRDEAVDALQEWIPDGAWHFDDVRKLYDAIAEGKIPGVKLDN